MRYDLIDLAPDAGNRLVRLIDGAMTRARGARGLLRILRDTLGAFGNLPGGGQQLADGGADLRHRRSLFLGAGSLLVGGGLQFRRRTLHLSDSAANLIRQRL